MDDAPPPASAILRHGEAAHAERAADIDGIGAVPKCLVDVGHGRVRHEKGGIVDEDIQRAEAVDRRLHSGAASSLALMSQLARGLHGLGRQAWRLCDRPPQPRYPRRRGQAPSSAKARQMARPISPPAPVTMATLPASLPDVIRRLRCGVANRRLRRCHPRNHAHPGSAGEFPLRAGCARASARGPRPHRALEPPRGCLRARR